LGGLVRDAELRKKHEEQHQFKADGKEIFSNHSKQTKAKIGEKMD
jgi:hypothetical protein